MASIRLIDASLTLPVRAPLSGARPQRSLSGGAFGRLVSRAAGRRVKVEVLEGINLTIQAGERVGLMGRNGSGKSSLLRIMAGIYEPSSGVAEIDGWSSPFLELGAGFDQDTSGIDNIYYRGYLMGLSKATIARYVDEIVDFADIGDYIYLPVHTYSSGMRARLALAVSTCVSPDILLLDEWVGAGDAAFLERAKQRMMSFVLNTRVLVFASHNRKMLQQVCDRGVVLDQGRVCFDGPVKAALDFYEADILQLPRAQKRRQVG